MFMIPSTFQKFNILLIFTFYYKYLKYRYYLLFRKNSFVFLKYVIVLTVLLECKTEKWNSQCEGANKWLVLHVRFRCASLSIATPVSLLANEIDVRSVLHGQVSLAAVNQIYVIHETMNGCKNLKIH